MMSVLSLACCFAMAASPGSIPETPYVAKATKVETAAPQSEPHLDLRPFRWNSPETAKLRYGNEVLRWARSQPQPTYNQSNRPPEHLSRVERKLFDAISVASSIPDSKADSLAKLQGDQRARIFEDAYKEAVKGILKLEPPNKILLNELKRDVKLALQPTQVGDGTSAAREITLRDLRAELGRKLDKRLDYERDLYSVRQKRVSENHAVINSIVQARNDWMGKVQDYQHLMAQHDQLRKMFSPSLIWDITQGSLNTCFVCTGINNSGSSLPHGTPFYLRDNTPDDVPFSLRTEYDLPPNRGRQSTNGPKLERL